MTQEEWRDIKGYEGLYKVSNNGRVWSIISNHELRQNKNHGYPYANLYKNGTKKLIKIHRLVCIAFIENVNNLPQINHKDGDKSNNHFSNLEWITASGNTYHAHKNGLIKNHTGAKGIWAKPVLNKQTGVIHDTMTKAHKEYGKYHIIHFGRMLNNISKNITPYVFISIIHTK